MEGGVSENFCTIAHNVKSLRRFEQVIGQCEALTPAQNVAEKKRTKALLRRLRFFVAGGALAPNRKPYVMCRLSVLHYFSYYYRDLKKD
jgi:hypothetical protein